MKRPLASTNAEAPPCDECRGQPAAVAFEAGHFRSNDVDTGRIDRLLEGFVKPPAMRRGWRGEQLECLVGEGGEARRVGHHLGGRADGRWQPVIEVGQRCAGGQLLQLDADGAHLQAELVQAGSDGFGVVLADALHADDGHPLAAQAVDLAGLN